MAVGHMMTGEALKKLQQQMKVNRDERRLTVRQLCFQLQSVSTRDWQNYYNYHREHKAWSDVNERPNKMPL